MRHNDTTSCKLRIFRRSRAPIALFGVSIALSMTLIGSIAIAAVAG
ncbi:MAG: hypothetical protein RIM33_13570 [Alphaproteobacteria bacterium]